MWRSRSPWLGEVGDINYRAVGIGNLGYWEEIMGNAMRSGQLSGNHGGYIGDITLSNFGDMVISWTM